MARLQAEMLERIAAEPPWSERMALPRVRADFVAVTSAVVARFVRLIGTPDATFDERDRARFRELGAGEAREGRGLEELLAAYRIGTRVLYTEFAQALAGLDPSPEAQVALGEAVFALVDTLQGESAEGYAREVSTHSGERERRLRRLVDALLAGEEDAVPGAAAQVGWTAPAAVAVALAPADRLAEARTAVGADGLVVERDAVAVAVVVGGPGLDGRLRRLAEAVGGGPVRVGPTVPVLDTRRSLAAASLLPEDGTGLIRATDRLPELLLRGVPEVAETLAGQALAPLASLREGQRERLAATLASWLRHWGQRNLIAADLAIHPQTVGYRVNQLRDLFGEELDHPDRRLELQLALLARADRGHR